MTARLFTFVQMELPWALGPADGRYLLRRRYGPQNGEPEHVVVLSTVGARQPRRLGRRARTHKAGSEPAAVVLARATMIDPVWLSAESQARAWLAQLDPERESHAAAGVLNRVLFAHRLAGASPHTHEISPAQALVVRAGFGEGEQVAYGMWSSARELLLSRRRTQRRAGALRSQERLAVLLAGRDEALLCEELVLRARLDLDQGRTRHAAIELERAYAAALGELPGEGRKDLEERIAELQRLQADVETTARTAMGATSSAAPDGKTVHGGERAPDDETALDETIVRHPLERLEAALRARTAVGFKPHEG